VQVLSPSVTLAANASADVTIVQVLPLPKTGASDYMNPLESTGRFLTPLGATAAGLPAIVWTTIVLLAIAVGGQVGRRFFF
jgi:hypothetical protein